MTLHGSKFLMLEALISRSTPSCLSMWIVELSPVFEVVPRFLRRHPQSVPLGQGGFVPNDDWAGCVQLFVWVRGILEEEKVALGSGCSWTWYRVRDKGMGKNEAGWACRLGLGV